jgi:hypothetical protein
MDKLQTLEISGSRYQLDCEIGTFSANFPALKKLVLNNDWPLDENSQLDFWESVSHPGVTHLVFNKLMLVSAACLSRIAAIFPMVTSVELSMGTPEAFTRIWSSWPFLKSLHIYYRLSCYRNAQVLDLDEHMTGIASWRFLSLKQELAASSPFNLDVINFLMFPYKIRPGISDLQHLQKFTLEIRRVGKDFGKQGYELTDIGGLFGIAMTNPRLQHVEIKSSLFPSSSKVYPEIGVSPQCRSLIREALGPFAYINL